MNVSKSILASAVVLACLAAGCDSSSSASTDSKGRGESSKKATSIQYSFDLQFNPIVTALLKDDAQSFANGDDSMIGSAMDLMRVTPKEMAKSYRENQVAGDQKFLKKRLFVSGQVASINSGIGNSPYIVFRDGELVGTQAHLASGFEKEAATLKKNQKVQLVCVGGGSIVGTPILKDCQFAATVAIEAGEKLAREIERFASGKKVSEKAARMALFAETIAREIDDGVDCSKGCLDIVSKKPKEGKFNDSLKSTVQQMRAGGLKVEELTVNS